MPTLRASAKLKRRTLAARLTALAERHIGELEASACVDAGKLSDALEILKMAKLTGMRRSRRRTEDGLWGEPIRPIIELCLANVDLHRGPRPALDDFLENRAPPREEGKPARRSRGQRLRGSKYYAWMREGE